MFKVGITGNIGSGKTTVCRLFELLNVEVYYADTRAKEILHSYETKMQIKKLFGESIFDQNGNLINQKLAEIVFNDRAALQRLNNIIHPQVNKDFELWANDRQSNAYVLKEAALIFESGSHKNLHKIILVASTTDLMIERVKKRDNVSGESIKKRLSNQIDQQTKISKADYVIYNDERRLLIPQVLEVHNKLLEVGFIEP